MPLSPQTYIRAFLPVLAILAVVALDFAFLRTGSQTISEAVWAVRAVHPKAIAYFYIAFWAFLGGMLTIHWFT